MSDEIQALVPSEPAEAPSPTDIPSAETAEAPPSAALDEVAVPPPTTEVEAPSTPAADEATPPVTPAEAEAPEASVSPETSIPPLPAAIMDAAEVSGDDKLLAALAWFTMVIFQLPILSIVLLLIEPNRNRPFQRYHAVASIAFWCVAVLYEIVVGLVMGMLTLVTLGLFAFCLICLWVVFFLPHIVSLIYAFYALTGRTPEIPVISRLAREQRWI